jgi:hypothetical protein
MEVPMKKLMNGFMAIVAFLAFSVMSPLAFAGEEKKEEKKDKGGQVVLYGDEKKDEKQDKGGK